MQGHLENFEHQGVVLPPESLASCVGASIQVPTALCKTQVCANALWKTVEDDPSAWTPAIHVRELSGVPDS